MGKTLFLQNEIEEINKLALFIEELGEELRLPHKLVFNLNLVLEEAVSNVIFYAYPKGEHHMISLSATKIENQLVFVLTDSGKPFDPTKAPDVNTTLSADERQIGGLGIFLIRQIMDKVEYLRIEGKNIFIMEKQLDNNNL